MASGQLRLIETAGHFKGLEPFVKRFKAAGAFVIHKCVAVRQLSTNRCTNEYTWSTNESTNRCTYR